MSSAMHATGPGSGRCALRLDPATERGWFGGSALCASDPFDVSEGVPLARAAAALEEVFEGRGDAALVAVVAAYDGTATVLRYAAAHTGLEAPVDRSSRSAPHVPLLSGAISSADPHRYRAGVREVRDAIAAGDVYVLNLTYLISGSPVLEGLDTYVSLLGRAPADMAAYVATPSAELASVSPERFVSVTTSGEGRVVEVWPIKGTRPRGADPDSDRAHRDELAASEKERAEHVMVVDMERNDLGRVCVPGSVGVEPLFEIVATPYCHQMVSRVHGVMRPDATFAQLLAATFPCGSVTGAPKVAAMRIAAELESAPRASYTGALLVARRGELDSSVLIRTARMSEGRLTWGTGSGITIDSDPAEEYLETLLKASPLTGDTTPPVDLRETCRVVRGHVPLLAYHLTRLAAGGCGPSQLARVRAHIVRALAHRAGDTTRSRLAVTAHADGGVTAQVSSRASSLGICGGPELVTVSIAETPSLPPGAAKPADRAVWDEAQERAGERSQAVLVTPDGRLVDGATATVWVCRGDRLLTPPAPPAVAGVAREVIFDLAPSCGLRAGEAGLSLTDLDEADEVFFTNAYAGVVGARGRAGPLVERLAQAYERYLDGRVSAGI